ncbi:outer membrane protein assembly factor BamD [Candidatus Pelagibacter sp.]|jgi:outer membrane protein assembly factor BamD|nr:outer membrane protein assembly factor BamD [Candidatus Pelagibacter sp.]
MNKFNFLFLFFLLFLSACSKDEKEISLIKETSQDLEMLSTYDEAYKALEGGDPYFAAKKFLEAELLFPQSDWAPRSALMASYSYYMQNYYAEALSNLERFLKTYPSNKNLAYAHYLIGMCYYETIEDEKRDSAPLIKARDKFNFVVEKYPNTDFALDAKFKLGLIQDVLASKEMYLGRHYVKKQRWIAAINRFKTVIEDYDQTIFVEEALHRLVEINYKLGLVEESQKYANVIGYNYLSGEWYKKSYKIFNKDYSAQIKKPIKKDKKGVIDKFKKLFD